MGQWTPGLLNQREAKVMLAKTTSNGSMEVHFFLCEMLSYSRHSPAWFCLADAELSPGSSPGLGLLKIRGLKIYY